MKAAQASVGTLNALADVAERSKGARPLPVQEGSKWKTSVTAVLLVHDGIVFLHALGADGDRTSYRDISAADILEDVDQKYTIEIRFRDEQMPRAVLVLNDAVFFMMVFAALTSAAISCHFSFTPKRLRTLGAQ